MNLMGKFHSANGKYRFSAIALFVSVQAGMPSGKKKLSSRLYAFIVYTSGMRIGTLPWPNRIITLRSEVTSFLQT